MWITPLSTILPIFSEFFIFCPIISQPLGKKQQKMRTEENIGHVVQGKRLLTGLSLMCKISTVC